MGMEHMVKLIKQFNSEKKENHIKKNKEKHIRKYKRNIKDEIIKKIKTTEDIFNYNGEDLRTFNSNILSTDWKLIDDRSNIKSIDPNLLYERLTCINLGIKFIPLMNHLLYLSIITCDGIKEIPMLPNLDTLIIKYNTSITKIPVLPKLKSLTLTCTFITSIPRLKKLITFCSIDNNILYLPNLPKLVYLECNSLVSLPYELPKIRELICKNKNIKCIPETYKNLRVLDIATENIKYIHDNFTKLKDITLTNYTVFCDIERTRISKDKRHIPRNRLIKYYNALLRFQRVVKLKKVKSKLSYIYNPRYIGGYIGKIRLTNFLN